MAQNVTLLGVDYPDVPSVELPKTGGGIATFYDMGEALRPMIDGSLTSIEIPDGATQVRPYAFYGLANLESVSIPGSATLIGNNAFRNCTALSSVTLNTGLLNIGMNVFSQCSSLKAITIPEGTLSLGNGAFTNSGITSIIIPSTLTGLGTAFSGCADLESAVIPSGVTSLQAGTFSNCPSLSWVRIGRPAYGSMSASFFNRCDNLTDLYVEWSEGEIVNAPWGATNATIHYNS